MKRISTAFTIFLFSTLQVNIYSTELKPWTDTDLMFYPQVDYRYQHYDKIHSSAGSKHRVANDSFLRAGVYGSYATLSAEAEFTFANTKKRDLGFDNLTLTGRYQLMNDIMGDPYSIIAGISYIAAPTCAVHDMSTFYHGNNEAVFHMSIGRERPCLETWLTRWWAVGLFGIADQGKPWWEAIAAWERNFSDKYFFRVFIKGLIGLGKHSLHFDDFDGYGGVRHRSIDLGARLTKATCRGNFWYAELTQRVYACNFPSAATQFKISYIFPFPATGLISRFQCKTKATDQECDDLFNYEEDEYSLKRPGGNRVYF